MAHLVMEVDVRRRQHRHRQHRRRHRHKRHRVMLDSTRHL
jgi:hypothetical protein